MPDFGSFRGFGEKLVQGQTPTQLGLIGSQGVSDIDPDAQAFFDRVTAAGGGTLSGTEQTAVNTLVLQMKLDGIWSAMKAIYPMVGASAAACAQNLKSSSFTGTFSSGWTFASSGLTPNGTSAFMNTNLEQSTNLTATSLHLSYYVNGGTFTANTAMAGFTSSTNSLLFVNAASLRTFCTNDSDFTGPSNINNGFYLGSRVSSILRKGYFNGTSVVSSSAANTPVVNLNYFLGALNNGGSGFLHGNFKTAFSSIGTGLDDTQASNFYTAVQAFQTTLSRNV
jgi:hypothetical protein